MKKSKMKNRIFFISLGIIIVVATGMIYVNRYRYDDALRQTALDGSFTPCAWERYPHLRYRMIEDMESQVDIQNLSRYEIIETLGLNEAYICPCDSIRYRICGSRHPRQGYWIHISQTETGRVTFFGIAPWS